MTEVPDVYADQFQFVAGPYGCTFNFQVTDATPPPQGAPPNSQRVVTIRCSLEMAKLMSFLLRLQIKRFERMTGMSVPFSKDILNTLHVGLEDWDSFWSD